MENNTNNEIFFDHKVKHNPWKEYKAPPCEALQLAIKEYMLIECTDDMELETLPSTSLSLDFILEGNVAMRLEDNSSLDLPNAVAFGIARKSFKFTFSGNTLLFVVIFNPGFAASVIRKPLNGFFEKFISLQELFSEQKISQLIALLKKQESFENMVFIIETFLLAEMDLVFTDETINKAIVQIKNRKGLVTINELTERLPISRDAFEKRFRAKVGTTPKRYANIVRFRDLFQSNHSKDNLTEIALKAGYYDQSHFIKDFKSSTGKLPSNFL